MTGYASARATLAAALSAAFETAGGWAVFDYPTDTLGDKAIAVSVGPANREAPGRWWRDLTVGMFVARHSVAASLDALDAAVPTVVDTLYGVDGVTVGEVTEPRVVTIGSAEYIAQFVPIIYETGT